MPAPSKILCILGTRPEAIKFAPLIEELRRRPQHFETQVCTTGQHRRMLDPFLRVFGIEVNHSLATSGSTPSRMTAEILTGLDPIFAAVRPDGVLVQGDTTTVAAASWAAFHQRIPVGHIEAGLRTYDRMQPFPEEINRRLTGILADLHFAPTQLARKNLLREGVPAERIWVTGNTVIDALKWAGEQPLAGPGTDQILELAELPSDTRLVLVTAHRRENHGAPLESICSAIRHLATSYEGRVQFVFPVHLNPRVEEPVRKFLGGVANVNLLPPQEYLPFVHLLKRADMVITDSGGLQEEAPGLGKPVLVLRNVTERPEAVAAGTVRLVGTETDRIIAEASHLLDDPDAYREMATAVNPYGDGKAAARIADALESFYSTDRIDSPMGLTTASASAPGALRGIAQ